MTTPFISLTVSVLYFGWLWHDQGARRRSQGQSSNQPTKKLTRANKSRALDLAPVSRVTPKPFDLENIPTPEAQGAAQ